MGWISLLPKGGCDKDFSWKDIETISFPMQNLPKFDAIIHLAGKAHDTKNQSAAQVYLISILD